MEAFFLIDKAKGDNSFKLVLALRKKLQEKSIGFAGTLDPLASGLMLLATGEFTKLLPYLEIKDKVYWVKVRLGATSETMDAQGPIFDVDASSYQKPNIEILNKLIEQSFVGKIEQTPPRYSAIQIDGKRAYDMARKGLQFEMKKRSVEIFDCQIVNFEFPFLEMEVHCSSGTYIRSLAHEIGEKLGCGGYVEELRRLKIGDLDLSRAVQIDDIVPENWIEKALPVEQIFSQAIWLDLAKDQYEILARGNFLNKNLVKGLPDQLGKALVLGKFEGKVVGVIEETTDGSELKFKKKFNIFG